MFNDCYNYNCFVYNLKTFICKVYVYFGIIKGNISSLKKKKPRKK